jgi:dolichyl-phosphooligosaccharide-protein glycotransferase
MLKINNISKRNISITLAIILIIFLVGFALRVESVQISGIPSDEKAFYEDQNGLPYMYELDSYYNYRLTENYIDHGYLGDTLINGTEWDLHSYYPPGVPMDYPPFIVYITTFIYKLVNLFVNTHLIVVCFWLPAFIGPLSGVIAYLFVRRFTNEYGAATAGILMATAPFYFTRTVPGWFDTDMFNIIFPLLIVWFFFEAIHSKNNIKRIIFTSLSVISMLLFAMAWDGWQYYFYLIVLFSIFYIIWHKLRGGNIKHLLYVVGVFFTGTLLLIIIFTGYLNVITLFVRPFQLLEMIGSNNLWIPWPNIYISVSELAKPTLEQVISGVGIAFFGGIFGFLWIFRVLINENLKKRFLDRMSWVFLSFLLLWTIIGFFALTEGSRFILLVIPPLVLSTGIMAGLCVSYLDILKDSKKSNIFKDRRNLTKIISIVIVLLFIIPAIANISASFSSFVPGANDDLWTASQWINNNTTNDTIIISDWSYGHFFTAIANRSVGFDGRLGYIETLPVRNYNSAYVFGNKSPGVAREYWIDRAFETGNESLSLGIFKMIATSGDLGYLTMDNYTKNTTKTVEILNNILGLNKDKALAVMTKNYSISRLEAQNVLKYTHPDNPRPFVLVTTNNMVNKGYWTFYFGSWDFNKIKGNDLTYTFGNIDINNNILNTSNGILMNLKTGNTTWDGQIPYSAITIKDGNIEKRYLNKNSTFDVIINIDSNKAIIIDEWFENSLFTKLVIEKRDSTYFKPSYINNNVIVWKST